jgi:RNA polymerase sigma-70 factor (sigma-E family)
VALPRSGGVAVSAPTLADFARDNTVALTRFAYLICGDRGRAEDLVQDAFVALYRRFGGELPVEAPVAYARRTIVNGHISRSRRRSVDVLAEVPDRPVAAAHNEDEDAMWRALATLPDRQRSVLVLRYYLDVPDHEIANILDCRADTVRSLGARAFATLRTSPELLSFDAEDELFPASQTGAGEVPVMAMPYLFARGRVVGLRTGASAPMADTVRFAADGVLAVEVGSRLSIVHTARLPQPRC